MTDSRTGEPDFIDLIDAEGTVYKAGEKNGTVLPAPQAWLYTYLDKCIKGEMNVKYKNRDCQFSFGPYKDKP